MDTVIESSRPRVTAQRAFLAAGASVTIVTVFCLWLAHSYQDDFNVYLQGARDLSSAALYTRSTRGDLFTYPPFAALVLLPLRWLPTATAAQTAWALLNEAELLALLLVALRAVHPDLPARSRRLWALGLAAPAFFLDPVLLAVRHGQVDILITLLVTWDLTTVRPPDSTTGRPPDSTPGRPPDSTPGRTPARRAIPLGVATGLAAAIKLTPLIFIPYLLLTRRFRIARNAVITFAGAAAIAFAVSPGSSAAYWTRYALDYKRAGGSLGQLALFAPTNQSLLAALGRLAHGPVPAGLELAAAAVIAVLGVALAAYVHAHWSPFLGLMLCATTGLLVSPVTWTHHMIWVLPVIIWLGTAPGRPRWGRPAAAASALLFWVSPIWLVPGHGAAPLHETAWQFLAGNAFFLWMLGLLAACAVAVRHRRKTVIHHVAGCPDLIPLSAVSCSNGSMNDRARMMPPQTRQTAWTG